MPIKYLPKAIIATIIAVVLFMHIMPDSIKGMPEWVFYSAFALSLAVGLLITTVLFKAVQWLFDRLG